ncbi:MAG: iron ABC transporter permease [Rhizobiaceae bacterium]
MHGKAVGTTIPNPTQSASCGLLETDKKGKMPNKVVPSSISNWQDQLAASLPVIGLALFLALTILPVLALLWIAAASSGESWQHLLNYVLPRSVWDTAILLLGVAMGTTILGAGCAWLTCIYEFPGRRFFTWAQVLPLAVPTYIAAYTHVEFFDYSGPVQSSLRDLFGFATSRDYWFPDIRTLGGAGFIFSLVLYPYVFLTSRLVFSMQGASALDVARSLGAGQFELFWRIALPMARPAVAAGVALALMETLNDIGAVEILGVRTLTYAVFETWLNRDNLVGAVQLALLTLLVIAVLIWIERRARRHRSYATAARERPASLIELSPAKRALCLLACSTPLLFGLVIPLWVLGGYALRRLGSAFDPDMLAAAANSFLVAIASATLATIAAYCILQYGRITQKPGVSTIGRIASLGYAVPGTVLAVGLLIPLAGFDNWLDGLMRDQFGYSTGLLFSGSVAIIIYACSLRFMAISYGTIEAGFLRVSPSIDMAARALGRNPREMAWQIHRPILTRAMSIAFLLVFVDTMKELSATILLRPFNFETLATFIYDRASQSALEDAALASIVIVLIGFVPVLFLTRLSKTI